jgi:predicted nucleotide-binding protein (sugar kinase/HSP70/actin superfamily)
MNFSEIIFELKKTKHKRKSKMELAPQITDCISSVRYLLEKSINKTFPFWKIDEIPYLIKKEGIWEILEVIEFSKLEIFDLLFFRNNKLQNKKNRTITHMWIYIWEWYVFQSWSKIIEKTLQIEKMYEKYNTISLINNYNKYAKKEWPNFSSTNWARS